MTDATVDELRHVGRPHAARTAQSRLEWVDVARGIGILLVVYGHALRGVCLNGGQAGPAWAIVQDRVIYAFHMPLFFMLAGLYVEQGLARGRRRFLADKVPTIVYPYFLWSIVEWTVSFAASRYTNVDLGVGDLLAIGWRPIHHFWFLYALLLCQIVAAFALPRLWPMAVLIVWPFVAPVGRFAPLISLFLMLPYFVLGIVYARLRPLDREENRVTSVLCLASAWALFAALIAFAAPAGDGPADRLLAMLIACAGIFGTLAAARLIRGRTAAGLALLGRASMTIFVLHTIFSAGMRSLMRILVPEMGDAALIAWTTAIGIAGPLAIYLALVRYGRLEWFGLGRTPQRQPATSVP